MSTIPFRFAMQATPQDGPQWLVGGEVRNDVPNKTFNGGELATRRGDREFVLGYRN